MYNITIKREVQDTCNPRDILMLDEDSAITMTITCPSGNPVDATTVEGFKLAFIEVIGDVGVDYFIDRKLHGTASKAWQQEGIHFIAYYIPPSQMNVCLFKVRIAEGARGKLRIASKLIPRQFQLQVSTEGLLQHLFSKEDMKVLVGRIAKDIPVIMQQLGYTALTFECARGDVTLGSFKTARYSEERHRNLSVSMCFYFGRKHTVKVKCDLDGKTDVILLIDTPITASTITIKPN